MSFPKKLLLLGLLLSCAYTVYATSPRSKYDAFKAKTTKSYNEFRKEANRRYADFIRKAWDEYSLDSIAENDNYDYVVPDVYIEDGDSAIVMSYIQTDDETDGLQESIVAGFSKVKKGISKFARRLIGSHEISNPIPTIVPAQPISPQPQPIAPIEVVPDLETAGQSFTFFGTDCEVSIPKSHGLDLEKLSNNNIANAWMRLSEDDFANTIKECLELRDSLSLNDWCYLKMLDALGNAIYGDSNESRLFTAYVLAQSGYTVRLMKANGQLGMLYAPDYTVYGPYFEEKGKKFYPYNFIGFNGEYVRYALKNESDFRIPYFETPKLTVKKSKPRHIKSSKYPDLDFDISLNENLIDFYNTYPDGFGDPNFMTRYAFRANVPLDPLIKETLYPMLREKLEGMNKADATNALLNFVQTGLVYKLDNEVWGKDRVFFAEETLFYPYCDCEDHAILFSKLVRDLVGLDVALVHYPGHLATAVCFGDEDVNGEYFIAPNGKKYVICDPTYKVSTVGMQMTCVDSTQLQFIEL